MSRLSLWGIAGLVLLLATAAGPGAVAAAEPSFVPVDETPTQPDFLAFRQELQQIVAARDTAALQRILDPAVKVSFDAEGGVAAFTRRWTPEAPDSTLWRELAAVLALGGAFEGRDTFVAPYVFARWPERYDSFEHVAITGTGVRVRATPSFSARQIATLSHTIVKTGDGESGEWTAVVLADGRRGYVASSFVRSPIDYRAFFTRQAGRWRLSLFVAGD